MYDEKELYEYLYSLYNSGVRNVQLMMKPSSLMAEQYGDKVPLGYPINMGRYADNFLNKVIDCKIEITNDGMYGHFFIIKSNILNSYSWSHYSFYLPSKQTPIINKFRTL